MHLDANFPMAHYWMGQALEQTGQSSEAIDYLQRLLARLPGCAMVMSALAHALASAGNSAAARAILDEIFEQETSGRYISSFAIAKVYLALGDIPAALTRLERAYDDRAHSMAYLRVDPQLRPLANEPRFRRLVEQVDQSPA